MNTVVLFIVIMSSHGDLTSQQVYTKDMDTCTKLSKEVKVETDSELWQHITYTKCIPNYIEE